MSKLSIVLSVAAILVLSTMSDVNAGHFRRGGCGSFSGCGYVGGCYGGGYSCGPCGYVYAGGCYGGGCGVAIPCCGSTRGGGSSGGSGGTGGMSAYSIPRPSLTPSQNTYVDAGRRESELPYDTSRFTQPRAWVRYGEQGTKVILGDLKSFARGEIQVEKYNRAVVSIPFDQLSGDDQKLVAAKYGQLVRTWVDRSGRYEQVARYRGTRDGQVQLETEAGRVLNVAVDKLSRADRAMVGLLSGSPGSGLVATPVAAATRESAVATASRPQLAVR